MFAIKVGVGSQRGLMGGPGWVFKRVGFGWWWEVVGKVW